MFLIHDFHNTNFLIIYNLFWNLWTLKDIFMLTHNYENEKQDLS